jgi:hypothetical protein
MHGAGGLCQWRPGGSGPRGRLAGPGALPAGRPVGLRFANPTYALLAVRFGPLPDWFQSVPRSARMGGALPGLGQRRTAHRLCN